MVLWVREVDGDTMREWSGWGRVVVRRLDVGGAFVGLVLGGEVW